MAEPSWLVRAIPHRSADSESDRPDITPRGTRLLLDACIQEARALRLVFLPDRDAYSIVLSFPTVSGPSESGSSAMAETTRHAMALFLVDSLDDLSFIRQFSSARSRTAKEAWGFGTRTWSPAASGSARTNPGGLWALPHALVMGSICCIDVVPPRRTRSFDRFGQTAAYSERVWAIRGIIFGSGAPTSDIERLLFSDAGSSLMKPFTADRSALENAAYAVLTGTTLPWRASAACTTDDIEESVSVPHPNVASVRPAVATYPLSTQIRPTEVGRPAPLPVDELTLARHVLVSGDPGTGKSTAVQGWLGDIKTAGIARITVIDPTKGVGEYTRLIAKGFRVYEISSDQAVNPLLPPDGVSLDRFTGYFVRAFDEATRLSDRYPFGLSALKNALSSLREGSARVPTIANLICALSERLSSEGSKLSEDGAGAAILGVRERLESVSGSSGVGFLCGDEYSGIEWPYLLEGSAIILLHRIENAEQRTIVALMLAAGLVSARSSEVDPPSSLVVFEEAHTFFPFPGASVRERPILEELLGSAIAEQRSRRQGFVFVEQRPRALPDSVISNAGSVFGFRNSDRVEAKRIAEKLNLPEGREASVSELPDFCAFVRVAGDPTSTLVRFADVKAPSLEDVYQGDAGGVGRAVLPWCRGCPRPCKGSFALDKVSREEVAMVAVPLNATGDLTLDYARVVLRASAAALVDRGLVPPYDPFGGVDPTVRQLAATYCLAGRQVAHEYEMDVSGRNIVMEALARWGRSGNL
jgi:hypothetical protein